MTLFFSMSSCISAALAHNIHLPAIGPNRRRAATSSASNLPNLSRRSTVRVARSLPVFRSFASRTSFRASMFFDLFALGASKDIVPSGARWSCSTVSRAASASSPLAWLSLKANPPGLRSSSPSPSPRRLSREVFGFLGRSLVLSPSTRVGRHHFASRRHSPRNISTNSAP